MTAAAVAQYESFINDVLKADLRKIETSLLQVNAEITDLIQQKHTLKVVCDKKIHSDGFKTQVNIGCNFFLEASVEDTSTLLMHIGLNHYLEFKTDEALKYLDARVKAYEEMSEHLRSKAADTKAHLKLMYFNLAQLRTTSSYVS